MTLDDLKNIDLNNISGWPLPVKLVGIGVVCVLLLFAGYYFVISGEVDAYQQLQAKEQDLKQEFLAKKALAINLPAYQQQMVEMTQTFGSLLRQLPNTTEVPDLLVDITQAGVGRGLEFVLFRPEKEIKRDFYAELPISLTVRGTYQQIAEFISDVAALPRIVTFSNISLKADAKGVLTMSATAQTYRYLEAGEAGFKPKVVKGRRP